MLPPHTSHIHTPNDMVRQTIYVQLYMQGQAELVTNCPSLEWTQNLQNAPSALQR